jgi:hypothetical protein
VHDIMRIKQKNVIALYFSSINYKVLLENQNKYRLAIFVQNIRKIKMYLKLNINKYYANQNMK